MYLILLYNLTARYKYEIRFIDDFIVNFLLIRIKLYVLINSIF